MIVRQLWEALPDTTNERINMKQIVATLFLAHDIPAEELTLVADASISAKDPIAAAWKLKHRKTPGPDGTASVGILPKNRKMQQLVLMSMGKGDPDSPSALRP